jgi:hypothetical protein
MYAQGSRSGTRAAAIRVRSRSAANAAASAGVTRGSAAKTAGRSAIRTPGCTGRVAAHGHVGRARAGAITARRIRLRLGSRRR